MFAGLVVKSGMQIKPPDGLLEMFVREADGIKHGACSGASRAVQQHARMETKILCGNLFHRAIVEKKFRRGKAEEFKAKTFQPRNT